MSVHYFMLPASVVHVLSFRDKAENVLGIVLKFLCSSYKLLLQEYDRTCRALERAFLAMSVLCSFRPLSWLTMISTGQPLTSHQPQNWQPPSCARPKLHLYTLQVAGEPDLVGNEQLLPEVSRE